MSRSFNSHHSDFDRRNSDAKYDQLLANMARIDLDEQVAEHHGVRAAPLARKRLLVTSPVTKPLISVEADRLARIAALQYQMMLVRGAIWESIDRLNDLVFAFKEVGHRSYDLHWEIIDLSRKADNLLQGGRQARKARPWFLAGIAA